MSKTHTNPWDYNNIHPIISQLERLCKGCGGNIYSDLHKPDEYVCIKCGGNEWEWVQEKDAQAYREQLELKQLAIRDEMVKEIEPTLHRLLFAVEYQYNHPIGERVDNGLWDWTPRPSDMPDIDFDKIDPIVF